MKRIIIFLIFLLLLPLVSAPPDLIDGIIAYYKLDEASGAVLDATGNYDGTNNGAATGAAGKIDDAYDFTDDDNVDMDAADNPAKSDTIGSISMWFNLDASQTHSLVSHGTSTASSNYAWLLITNSEVVEFHGDGTWAYGTASGLFNTGTWYHLVMTSDGSDTKLYIDGSEVTFTVNSGSDGQFWGGRGTDTFALGELIRNGESHGADAIFDEVGLWDKELSSAEVTALYNGGDGLTYPFVVDTCTCPGAGNNWEIDMSDNCQIDDACDLTTGTLSFTGAGYCNCNASIDTTNLGDPGSSGILYIQDSCLITID